MTNIETVIKTAIECGNKVPENGDSVINCFGNSAEVTDINEWIEGNRWEVDLETEDDIYTTHIEWVGDSDMAFTNKYKNTWVEIQI